MLALSVSNIDILTQCIGEDFYLFPDSYLTLIGLNLHFDLLVGIYPEKLQIWRNMPASRAHGVLWMTVEVHLQWVPLEVLYSRV